MSLRPALVALLAGLLLGCGAAGDADNVAGSNAGNHADSHAGNWVEQLAAEVERIDRDTDGRLGVHVRNLADGRRLDHDGERMWYLASTTKVPLAIAVLQQVEAGVLSLEQELTLQQSDFVDGAGDLIWQEPGSRHSIRSLLGKSLVDSDSTATDMLIRLIGEDELNRRVRAWVGEGFGPITTIVQVRYDAYGLMHPGVAELSNMDLVQLRNADAGRARMTALARALGVEPGSLAIDSIEDAFEQYYASHKNSATLSAFATLLEKLVGGELLSAEHTALVLDEMRRISTGERRIKAGLPRGAVFAQKTGTQSARACNVGVLLPNGAAPPAPVVVAACVENFSRLDDAERALKELGSALAEVGLLR
jgi:beta-lactamase class A